MRRLPKGMDRPNAEDAMTQPLYTIDAVLEATGGRAEGIEADAIRSISIDSREIGPDALFVAIKGDRFDGHDFVDTALANGAAAALVSRGTDWQIVDAETAGEHSFATVLNGGDRYALTIGVAGRHMLSNATAALAVASLAGIAPETALRALAGFGPQPGRGPRIHLGPKEKPLLLIDESYNANTASMTAALDVFGSVFAPNGKKVVVLGDMLELGEAGPALHAGLADTVRASGADKVYLVGPNMARLAEALPAALFSRHFTGIEQGLPELLAALAYGDAVMVKGSNGIGLSRLVAAIKDKFEQR